MQLKWFHVREFQSVRDSGRIEADEITCLVGKNEAGKTALLKALYRLNPVVPTEAEFSVTKDYPRMDVEDYRHDVEAGKRQHAVPIQAGYALDDAEIEEIDALFGRDCIRTPELTLAKSYDNNVTFGLAIDDTKALATLIAKADLPDQLRGTLKPIPRTAAALVAALKSEEQTAEVKAAPRDFDGDH